MSKTSLRTSIARVSARFPDRPALVTPTGSWSYNELSQVDWRAGGASIVIYCRAIENVVRALVALDGAVPALCVLPSDLPDATTKALLAKWDFDTVVSDRPREDLGVFLAAGLKVRSVAEFGRNEGHHSGSADPVQTTTWLVPTSGTTAVPKLVSHSFQSLAPHVEKVTGQGPDHQVWALFYDVSRFAGYQVLLRSLIRGDCLVVPDMAGAMDARVKFCATNSVSHVSATPTLWRKILMSPASRDLDLRQITLGGEAADQPVLSALARAFPKARVTHVYASTEAGLGLSVSDGKAGFPLAFLGSHVAGLDVAIHDDRLFIRSANAGQKYSGEADFRDAEGWVDTGDLVAVNGDRFQVVGRMSGVLNVGGDKVVPEQVRHTLLESDIVVDAVIYGKSNPFTGTLVIADVKLVDGIDETEARSVLDKFLNARLSSAQRPRIFRFVDEITTNSTGKISK